MGKHYGVGSHPDWVGEWCKIYALDCSKIDALGVFACQRFFMWRIHFSLNVIRLRLIGSIHKSVDRSLYPRKITFFLYITSHIDFVNNTKHPAFQRTRMPINGAIVNLGTMCPINTVGGPGIVMLHMCVDLSLLPSGKLIVNCCNTAANFWQRCPSWWIWMLHPCPQLPC